MTRVSRQCIILHYGNPRLGSRINGDMNGVVIRVSKTLYSLSHCVFLVMSYTMFHQSPNPMFFLTHPSTGSHFLPKEPPPLKIRPKVSFNAISQYLSFPLPTCSLITLRKIPLFDIYKILHQPGR